MKKYITQWKAIIFLQGIITTFLFTFIVYQTWNFYGANNLIIILLLPLAMLFFTPIWAKIKHKKSNHSVIKITSFILWIILTLISFFPLINFNYNLLIYSFLIFFLGISFAGLVPFTYEIVRSYYLQNLSPQKFYPHLITFWGIIIIPVSFFISYSLSESNLGQIINGIIISVISGIHLILIWTAKNLQTKEITFLIKKYSWEVIKKNKFFWYYLLFTSWQVNLFEVISYLLPIILFFSSKFLILIIMLIYVIRKTAIFFGENISYKFTNKSIIIISQLIFCFTLGLFCFVLFNYYYNSTLKNKIIYIIFGLIFSQLLWGIVIGYHNQSQGRMIKCNNINEEDFSLALMLIHVFGRAIGAILLGVIIFVILIITNFSISAFAIIISVLLLITFIIFISSFLIKKLVKNKKK